MAGLIYQKQLPFGRYEVYNDRPSFSFYQCKQIHSALVVQAKQASTSIEADGLFTSSKEEAALAIVTADCLPIVLGSDKGVGFVHAGWKGLQQEIIAHELIKSIVPTYAFIGPHISSQYYQVGEDFIEHFPDSSNCFTRSDGELFFNLECEAKRQIEHFYGPITIECSNICTYSNPTFHSYRKNQTSLRNWNILRIE